MFFSELNGIFSRVLCSKKCNMRCSTKVSVIGSCMTNSVLRVPARTDTQVLHCYQLPESIHNFRWEGEGLLVLMSEATALEVLPKRNTHLPMIAVCLWNLLEEKCSHFHVISHSVLIIWLKKWVVSFTALISSFQTFGTYHSVIIWHSAFCAIFFVSLKLMEKFIEN